MEDVASHGSIGPVKRTAQISVVQVTDADTSLGPQPCDRSRLAKAIIQPVQTPPVRSRQKPMERPITTSSVEAVIADPGPDAGRRRAPADHGVRVLLGQGSARQLAGAAAEGAEEGALWIADETGAGDVGGQDLLERVMAGHGVMLAALFVQPHPQPAVLRVDVLDLHGQGGAHAGERVDHQADEGLVAQPRRRRRIDQVQQPPRLGRIEHRRFELASPLVFFQFAWDYGVVGNICTERFEREQNPLCVGGL